MDQSSEPGPVVAGGPWTVVQLVERMPEDLSLAGDARSQRG